MCRNRWFYVRVSNSKLSEFLVKCTKVGAINFRFSKVEMDDDHTVVSFDANPEEMLNFGFSSITSYKDFLIGKNYSCDYE